MTTIVKYKNSVAYDGRVTAGSEIVTDSDDKAFVIGDITIVCAGDVAAMEVLKSVDWNLDWNLVPQLPKKITKQLRDVTFILITPDSFPTYYFTGKEFTVALEVVCLGSGSEYAFGALRTMEFYCESLEMEEYEPEDYAREAVKMAMLCDSATGGEVRSITFKEPE